MNRQELNNWLSQYGVSPLRFGQKPLVMGVLNLTPDSFYDGGQYASVESALSRCREMISQGVDLIDVGGESTRPQAAAVSLQEELDRVMPVIEALRQESDICISLDTYKAKVMQLGVEAGVDLINDVRALLGKDALDTAAQLQVPICLMHMQGEPENMQTAPHYEQGVTAELLDFFSKRIQACHEAGIQSSRLLLDPGFGFGKTAIHNVTIMRQLTELLQLGLPLVLGVSRKSTLGAIVQAVASDRLAAGLALAVYACMQGVAVIRTHDVAQTQQALLMLQAVYQQSLFY